MIRYFGGKSWLHKYIDEHLPPNRPDTMVDLFVGGGNFVDYAYKRFKKCVINDIDSNLINFYNQLKSNDYEVIVQKFLQWRDGVDFESSKKYKKELLDSKEMGLYECFLIYALSQVNYSGKLYNVPTRYQVEQFIVRDIPKDIRKCKEVLSRCDIHNEDYHNIVLEGAFYYCDPPYADVGANNYYGNKGENHKNFDHYEFKKYIDDIAKNNFVLISYEDSDFIRELYKGWNMVTIDKKSVFINNGENPYGESKQTNELLIFNYDIDSAKYANVELF